MTWFSSIPCHSCLFHSCFVNVSFIYSITDDDSISELCCFSFFFFTHGGVRFVVDVWAHVAFLCDTLISGSAHDSEWCARAEPMHYWDGATGKNTSGPQLYLHNKQLLSTDVASLTHNRLSHTRGSRRLFGIIWLTL